VVTRDRKASTSYIQRRLQIGYNRAASFDRAQWRRRAWSAPPITPASARFWRGRRQSDRPPAAHETLLPSLSVDGFLALAFAGLRGPGDGHAARPRHRPVGRRPGPCGACPETICAAFPAPWAASPRQDQPRPHHRGDLLSAPARPGRASSMTHPQALVVAANGFRVAVLDKRLENPRRLSAGGRRRSASCYPATSASISRWPSGRWPAIPGASRFSPLTRRNVTRAGSAWSLATARLGLAGWTITDGQGGVTRVRLADFAPGKAMPKRFLRAGARSRRGQAGG